MQQAEDKIAAGKESNEEVKEHQQAAQQIASKKVDEKKPIDDVVEEAHEDWS